MELHVNGRPMPVAARPGETLLEVLRDRLGLGTVRETCALGVCGACTVLADGRPVSSCLALAELYQDKRLETLEGLQPAVAPVQERLLAHEAVQCGWCTPGFVLTVEAMRRERPGGTWERAEVEEYLSGNICRCTGYLRLVEAALEAVNAGA